MVDCASLKNFSQKKKILHLMSGGQGEEPSYLLAQSLMIRSLAQEAGYQSTRPLLSLKKYEPTSTSQQSNLNCQAVGSAELRAPSNTSLQNNQYAPKTQRYCKLLPMHDITSESKNLSLCLNKTSFLWL